MNKQQTAINPSAPDLETRLIEEDHHSIKLWLRLLTCSSLIEAELRGRLREEFDTTLPRFDFLSQLQRAPQGLTMGELSRRMMVSGGNVSGLSTQLVKEGLVSRSTLPEDRRTYMVTLTPVGKKFFAKIAKRHEEWVIELLGDLSHDDVDQLAELLAKVKTTVSKHSVSGGGR